MIRRALVALAASAASLGAAEELPMSPLGRTLGRERMFFNVQAAVQHYEQIAASRPSVVDRV